jgi:hypothetical protein
MLAPFIPPYGTGFMEVDEDCKVKTKGYDWGEEKDLGQKRRKA